jgi:hypothetical protein
MKKLIIIILLLAAELSFAAASRFEELDKPPEGAHEGQMFFGASVGMGIPFGDIINAEKNFVKGNIYTFEDIGTTKELLVTHLSYDYGLTFEYMPVDYVGVKSKLKRVVTVQRTVFGSNYQNWNESIFESFLLTAGPSFHLTNRKMWDITLSPFLGYYTGKYTATPIADKLIDGYSGSTKRDVSGFSYGAELSITGYFSGGLYISLGIEWSSYQLSFSPSYNLTQNGNTFMEGKNSGSLQTANLVLSAGYAFDN